jgi:hypothetical protein
MPFDNVCLRIRLLAWGKNAGSPWLPIVAVSADLIDREIERRRFRVGSAARV